MQGVTQIPATNQEINRAVNRIKQIPANTTVTQLAKQGVTQIPATIQEISYHMISREPFTFWQQDAVRTVRLGKLSQVLESYCLLPFSGNEGSSRGNLRTERTIKG